MHNQYFSPITTRSASLNALDNFYFPYFHTALSFFTEGINYLRFTLLSKLYLCDYFRFRAKLAKSELHTRKINALPNTQPCFFIESLLVCILTIYSPILSGNLIKYAVLWGWKESRRGDEAGHAYRLCPTTPEISGVFSHVCVIL